MQEPVLVDLDPVVVVENVKADGSEQSQGEAGESIEGKCLPIIEFTEELVSPFFNLIGDIGLYLCLGHDIFRKIKYYN